MKWHQSTCQKCSVHLLNGPRSTNYLGYAFPSVFNMFVRAAAAAEEGEKTLIKFCKIRSKHLWSQRFIGVMFGLPNMVQVKMKSNGNVFKCHVYSFIFHFEFSKPGKNVCEQKITLTHSGLCSLNEPTKWSQCHTLNFVYYFSLAYTISEMKINAGAEQM